MAEEQWVEVTRVGQDEDAEILKDFFDSEGIEASVDNQKFHMEPVNFGDLTRIRILVRKSDEEAARRLLAERDRAFESMKRRGDEESILTDSGPQKAPESD
jgi:hypothetical protein